MTIYMVLVNKNELFCLHPDCLSGQNKLSRTWMIDVRLYTCCNSVTMGAFNFLLHLCDFYYFNLYYHNPTLTGF